MRIHFYKCGVLDKNLDFVCILYFKAPRLKSSSIFISTCSEQDWKIFPWNKKLLFWIHRDACDTEDSSNKVLASFKAKTEQLHSRACRRKNTTAFTYISNLIHSSTLQYISSLDCESAIENFHSMSTDLFVYSMQKLPKKKENKY